MNKRKKAIRDVKVELKRASKNHKPFNSPHEGYSVLFEEVDELWGEVRLKPRKQSKKRMRAEAVQIAAMALRFILDLT